MDDIMKNLMSIRRSGRSEKTDTEEKEIEVYNIPISKLIAFIMKYRAFGNKEFLKEIVCDNSKYKLIAELFENRGILVR